MTLLPSYKTAGAKEWVCGSTDEYGVKPYCEHSYLIWCSILFVYCVIMTLFNVAEQRYL